MKQPPQNKKLRIDSEFFFVGNLRNQMLRIRIILRRNIIEMMSAIQIMFQPNTIRRMAANILPSSRRVMKLHTRFVTGIMHRIRLTT